MDENDKPPAPERMNWGDEIRKIQEGQGLSQRRLAKLADVNRAPVQTNTGCAARSDKRWSTK